MPRPPPVRRGGWPCGWITAPSICRTTFTNQIKFWGIQPSYAFVEQPQTNGVAERFNRTLKEQIIHGRIYRNIAELRNAVRGFVEQYNAQWIVEKNGYLSPRSSSSGVAHRDVTQARRMRQTCVQGTGCDTKARKWIFRNAPPITAIASPKSAWA